MYYEQDYIMRLIKQVIRALIGVLLNKKTLVEYGVPEEIAAEGRKRLPADMLGVLNRFNKLKEKGDYS